MKIGLKFFCLALWGLGCEEAPLPPCQLSQSGWVCRDQGLDASKVSDVGENGAKDLGRSRDLRSSSDLSADLSSDVQPKIDMERDTPKNCGEVSARDLPTGNYDIELEGQILQVHCNNDVDGGGWMLVGRSVVGGTGIFGWDQKAGAITDDNAAFSLGLTSVPFTQILATNYTTGKRPGDRQYVITLPNDFLKDCTGTSCQTTVISPTSSCSNNVDGNDIFMFDYAGWVGGNDNLFWFRERVEDATTGFRRDGWNLFFDDCRSGELHTQQGLLFVR